MQNPPPDQGYGNYGGAPSSPPPAAGGPTGKSAIGLDSNLAAALGYPIGILAIVNLVMEKENRFVRFHAMQSIVLLVLGIVLSIVLFILFFVLTIVGAMLSHAAGSAAGSLLGLLGILLWGVFGLAMFGAVVLGAFKAYQNEMYKLPVIGNIAEKFIK
jgi:uncharacterized membrane protein